MPGRWLQLAALCSVLIVAGCGDDRPAVYPVTGTVTYQGQPVRGASVTFHPEEGPSASGVTDESGRFSLTTIDESDGAPPGEHVVTVVALSVPGTSEYGESLATEDVNEPIEGEAEIDSTPIPEKYASPQTSGLKQIVKEEPNEITIKLSE